MMLNEDKKEGAGPPPAAIPSELATAPSAPAPQAPPSAELPADLQSSEPQAPAAVPTSELKPWAPTATTFQEETRQKVLTTQASNLIRNELGDVFEQVKAIPAVGLPGRKVHNLIQQLKDRANAILVPAKMSFLDLPEREEVRSLEIAYKETVLKCYIDYIAGAERVSPFATFNEIFDARFVEGDPAGEVDATLNMLFEEAVNRLFAHPSFVEDLLDKLEKKMSIIGQKPMGGMDRERQRMAAFLVEFELHKDHNPDLIDNTEIEVKIGEMDALLFFQEQTEMLMSGEYEASDDLIEYINNWMGYLNELSLAEQREKKLLIEAADRCSMAHNAVANGELHLLLNPEPVEVDPENVKQVGPILKEGTLGEQTTQEE